MPWNIFRSKTQNKSQRTASPAPPSRSQHYRSQSTPLATSSSSAVSTARTLPTLNYQKPNSHAQKSRGRPTLDPESNPLDGSYAIQSSAPSTGVTAKHAPSSRQHSTNPRRLPSTHSATSSNSNGRAGSIRSLKSGAGSMLSRHIKAAHAAKRAAAQYIASNSNKRLMCYTCGNQISEVRCGVCRTTYLPPEFRYSSANAALFGIGESNGFTAMSSTSSAKSGPGVVSSSSATVSGVSISNVSISGNSVSGAASFIGFFPETEEEPETDLKIDLELVNDLIQFNEATLLEGILFESFSNIDTIVNTFCTARTTMPTGLSSEEITEPLLKLYSPIPEPLDKRLSGGIFMSPSTSREATPLLDPPQPVDGAGESTCASIDSHAVKRFYDMLDSIPSTAPMRGIFQGAQAALQTRQHVPPTEKELAFVCVILQCPAIANCSMFTKLTGPLQKLSRYASLRSRARTLLEVCAGLMAHSDDELRLSFINVFAAQDIEPFANLVDLCNAYVSHRLSFDFHYKSGTANKPSKFQLVKHDWYADDWRISVVVKLMALLWEANAIRSNDKTTTSLPTNQFYNTMVDLVDLRSDFDVWQTGRTRKFPKFCFCRYPFLLSMGSKAKVFEHGAQREVNAAIQRELFALLANSRHSRDIENQQMQLLSVRQFIIRVRRQHLLEDSLRFLNDWPHSQRRALKVEFEGEPGIDAGGLKREWFLMFYKQLFAPELQVFVMNEISNCCWFGKHPDLNYYRAAGTALGLALFNSITIELNLPLLLFKLLLNFSYDLNDVGELWPDIAQSLQTVLDYGEPDFEDVFGLTFVAPDGSELISGGEHMNVTLSSKETYVKLIVERMVNTQGVQFQVFKDAFLAVCGGNAISFFQPAELELLIRGDRKPIDVKTLRSVTKYINFGHRYGKANTEPVVQWFWDYFEKLEPGSQARLLQFVTATDRAPAAGMVQMKFSIMCLGGDSERLPIAHTCFNQLCLYKYKSRQKLEQKLSLAIVEYQGFGLK